MERIVVQHWWFFNAVTGFPNRSVFSGKGPDPDLFVLQGPENGPDFTEKSGFLS